MSSVIKVRGFFVRFFYIDEYSSEIYDIRWIDNLHILFDIYLRKSFFALMYIVDVINGIVVI